MLVEYRYLPLCVPALPADYQLKVVVPAYLRPLMIAAKRVGRYITPGSPVLVVDSDESHQLRIAEKALLLLCLPPTSRMIVSHLGLIHDMCEIPLEGTALSHDLSSPDKEADPVLARQVDETELLRAKEHLTPADFTLWQDFERAKAFLKERALPSLKPPTFEAYVTKILDITDGDMFFHFSASNVIQKKVGTVKDFPPGWLNFGPKQYLRYRQRIPDLALNPEEKRIIQGLLSEMLIFYVHQWNQVDDSLRPAEVNEVLLWASPEIQAIDTSWLYQV